MSGHASTFKTQETNIFFVIVGIKWPKAVFNFTAHINLSKAALKIHFMSSKHIFQPVLHICYVDVYRLDFIVYLGLLGFCIWVTVVCVCVFTVRWKRENKDNILNSPFRVEKRRSSSEHKPRIRNTHFAVSSQIHCHRPTLASPRHHQWRKGETYLQYSRCMNEWLDRWK